MENRMGRQRFTPEQIIAKPREPSRCCLSTRLEGDRFAIGDQFVEAIARQNLEAVEERATIIVESDGALGPPMSADGGECPCNGPGRAAGGGKLAADACWSDPVSISDQASHCSCYGRHGRGGRWWRAATYHLSDARAQADYRS
jgi:hypothetical protein